MKQKFNLRNVKFIPAVLIITCSILFSEKAFSQSMDSWEEVESTSKIASILGAIGGACIITGIVLLIVNSGKDDKEDDVDDNVVVEKKSSNKDNAKDSTSAVKQDTLSTKKKDAGK